MERNAEGPRSSESAMKLSISCCGGHVKSTIGGRGGDYAICDRISEVKIPVAALAIRNPASRSKATLFAYSRWNDLARVEMAADERPHAVAKRRTIWWSLTRFCEGETR